VERHRAEIGHPQVAEHYRQGHRLAQESATGSESTEDLRQAMRHYRALFEELVEPVADNATTREQREDRQAMDNHHPNEERTVR
jgi:hypothetical protein